MKKNNNLKRRYFITILLLFLLRALDLFLTYIYIPDLSNEYNPIVSLFGASWIGLISVQLVCLIIIAIIGFFYFKQRSIIVLEKNLNFTEFIYCYFNNELKPWRQRLWSSSVNFESHIIFFGFISISGAILVSILAILNNFLLIMDIVWYRQFLTSNYKIFFPAIFFLVIISLILLFFKREYSDYLDGYSKED
ncbi:hypothetical protein ACFL3L_01335 [Candidatus Neomarinimicrobiota bacterium]